ncbi:hypothetical protein C8F01DRAFT_1367531 [Mycena amicta]|nr:hypothetical protein C8F01DRAFT_1367531 [Mycena amicta]
MRYDIDNPPLHCLQCQDPYTMQLRFCKTPGKTYSGCFYLACTKFHFLHGFKKGVKPSSEDDDDDDNSQPRPTCANSRCRKVKFNERCDLPAELDTLAAIRRSLHAAHAAQPTLPTVATPSPSPPRPNEFLFIAWDKTGPASIDLLQIYSHDRLWARPGQDQPYEAYSCTYDGWVRVAADYRHRIQPGKTVVVRTIGALSPDMEDVFAAFLGKSLSFSPSSSAAPTRTSTAPREIIEVNNDDQDEHKPRLDKGKGRARDIIEIFDTDEEEDMPTTKRPRLSIRIPSGPSSPSHSSSSTPALTTASSASSLPYVSTSPSSPFEWSD